MGKLEGKVAIVTGATPEWVGNPQNYSQQKAQK